MKGGKKATTKKLLFQVFFWLQTFHKVDPFFVFLQAVNNVSPSFRVKKRGSVGVGTVEVVFLSKDKRLYYALKQVLIGGRKQKKFKSFAENLAYEIYCASLKLDTSYSYQHKLYLHQQFYK